MLENILQLEIKLLYFGYFTASGKRRRKKSKKNKKKKSKKNKRKRTECENQEYET